MAVYLITTKVAKNTDTKVPATLSIVAEVTAKNIQDAITKFKPKDGIAYDVYRVAGKARRVTVVSETVRKVVIE